MAEHTPGPWRAVSNVSDTQWRVEAPDGGICVPCYGRDDHLLSGVNARLIAAAPDLLEALYMVRDANRDEPHIPPPALASIEAAIAKAEGRDAS